MKTTWQRKATIQANLHVRAVPWCNWQRRRRLHTLPTEQPRSGCPSMKSRLPVTDRFLMAKKTLGTQAKLCVLAGRWLCRQGIRLYVAAANQWLSSGPRFAVAATIWWSHLDPVTGRDHDAGLISRAIQYCATLDADDLHRVSAWQKTKEPVTDSLDARGPVSDYQRSTALWVPD